MKISSIICNWFYSIEVGEQYTLYTVGQNCVKEITEHRAQGEGDKWYYDVLFEDGSKTRVFNISTVNFSA